jgi:hypothetical protein
MDKLKNKIQEHIDQLNVDEPTFATWAGIKNKLSESNEKDLLKSYVTENKDKLNIEAPDVESWERISKVIAIGRQQYVLRTKKLMLYLSAACIMVIVSLGVLRYISQPNNEHDIPYKQSITNSYPPNDTTNVEITKKQIAVTPSLAGKPLGQTSDEKNTVIASTTVKKQKTKLLPPMIVQIERDYEELISGQIKYTKSLAIYGESAGYFQQFMNDFKALEKQEKELRRSIAQNGLQENSIDDLITINQLKLTILKKLQIEINKTSNRNKNVTDTVPTYLSL